MNLMNGKTLQMKVSNSFSIILNATVLRDPTHASQVWHSKLREIAECSSLQQQINAPFVFCSLDMRKQPQNNFNKNEITYSFQMRTRKIN